MKKIIIGLVIVCFFGGFGESLAIPLKDGSSYTTSKSDAVKNLEIEKYKTQIESNEKATKAQEEADKLTKTAKILRSEEWDPIDFNYDRLKFWKNIMNIEWNENINFQSLWWWWNTNDNIMNVNWDGNVSAQDINTGGGDLNIGITKKYENRK